MLLFGLNSRGPLFRECLLKFKKVNELRWILVMRVSLFTVRGGRIGHKSSSCNIVGKKEKI